MKGASFETVIERLKAATGSKSLAALGKALGISSQAVYDAKNREAIPERWILIAATKFGLQPEDLLAPSPEEAEHISPALSRQDDLPTNRCDNCKELALERQERRILAEENRKLYNRCLEQERIIGELRLALQAADGGGNGSTAATMADMA